MHIILCINWRIEGKTEKDTTWGTALRDIELPCFPPLEMTIQATNSVWGAVVDIIYDVQEGGIWVEILLEDSEEKNSISADIVNELKQNGWDIDYLEGPRPEPRLKLVQR